MKLTDADGNFAYDYIMPEKADFCLYSVGKAPELDKDSYTVECLNEKCSAEIVRDRITVSCPRGEESLIRISDNTGAYSDSIYVSNKLNLIGLWQKIELNLEEGLELYELPTYLKNGLAHVFS